MSSRPKRCIEQLLSVFDQSRDFLPMSLHLNTHVHNALPMQQRGYGSVCEVFGPPCQSVWVFCSAEAHAAISTELYNETHQSIIVLIGFPSLLRLGLVVLPSVCAGCSSSRLT